MSTEIASFSGPTTSLKFIRYCGSKTEQWDSRSQYRERLQIGFVSLSCEEAVDLAVKLLRFFPVNDLGSGVTGGGDLVAPPPGD